MTFDETRLAWAAGLFEGEGCFHFRSTKQGRTITAKLVSTDLDVVEKFKDTVQVGKMYGPTIRGVNKPYWTWVTTSFEDTQVFICLVWKFLCSRRKAKAKQILMGYAADRRGFRKKFWMPSGRLSQQDVTKIKELSREGISQTKIGKVFNRHQSYISMIVSGKRRC